MKIPREVARQREKEVWEMRQKMWTQEQIAQKIGITQPAVNQILKRLTSRYAAQFSDDIERVKAEQIAQLELVAAEAMLAWERSKDPSKTAWVKRPLGGDSKPINDKNGKPIGEQTNEVRDQDGDPRYLNTAMKAKEDIRKIIGADAPTKNVNFDFDVTKLSDDELRAIIAGESPC